MTTTTTTTSSSSSSFFDKLETRVKAINSHLCVGLDPHLKEITPHPGGNGDRTTSPPLPNEDEKCDAAFTFCKTIIDATAPHAAAYKPNAAFFEALGPHHGVATLRRVIAAIPEGIPVLLDAKRGDIGSTAAAYADACYEGLGADGVTLSPFMGWDSVEPFVTGKYADKGAFLLCKTSNPGSNDILSLPLQQSPSPSSSPDDHPTTTTVYEKVAQLCQTWSCRAATSSTTPCLGLVIGATDPAALSLGRTAGGDDVWILAPGVGAQGGDLVAACRAGLNSRGSGLLVPVSRGISRAEDLERAARELKEGINRAREEVLKGGGDEDGGAVAEGGVTSYQREFLEFSLGLGVLKFGEFVLKSGRTSPYFFNAGLFASGGALAKLAKCYAAAIMASKDLRDENGQVKFDVVFGPAYKGISLGAVVCASLYNDYQVDVGFAYNRKEKKDHGEGGLLVGASMENKRVLIIDDVITAGTAIRESYTTLTKINAIPTGVVIALDRAEKRALDDPVSAVQAVARDLDLPVVSIVSLPQLQAFLKKGHEKYGSEVLEAVSKYRDEYGV
eukprot:CAMPEP_0172489422 /NCGR_PEP_ID=MMETSP1066-20121228/19378_1 /TAXON_ID=671091 /ORGANISM="Coscinodiscus wailesii, Strain CCMP2513" /LENGTH=558 /DNA_ID=CAMNT_0013257255 /DNA_START=223 /DNA_END=1899 /DNA_ORIENTATION=+